MKSAILRIILAFLCFAALPHPARAGGDSDSSASATIVRIEHAWVDALAKRDTAILQNLFADSYIDGDETGDRSSKAGVLAVVRSGDLKIRSIKLSNMHVNVYGDAAVVTGDAVQTGSYKGTPLMPKVVFTDTFILRQGRWMAVASQRAPRR